MKLNKRGFSLVEVLSATALIAVLSVFSVTQYNKHKTKSYTKEAKLQLGHLHRMEAAYHMEHNTFTFEVSGNLFPKGTILYNVGFAHAAMDLKVNPCRTGDSAIVNNYYELCGDDLTTGRPECGFRSKKGNVPSLTSAYLHLRSMHYHKPNHNCRDNNSPPPDWADVSASCTISIISSLSTAELQKVREESALGAIADKNYHKYIAYAVGDILDPLTFSTTDLNKLDVWRINGNGFLEHCNDPMDDNTSNTCHTPAMGKTEGDPNAYCS
ncbi:MAG: prepilin-type N-terminal cleavage/methylation domain-containing protein [Bdellovibrionales bacterium]|nr:prepilin-type N-terminal cleavage/methylation domain-containing protein [Bdellovibrionales bacterium]